MDPATRARAPPLFRSGSSPSPPQGRAHEAQELRSFGKLARRTGGRKSPANWCFIRDHQQWVVRRRLQLSQNSRPGFPSGSRTGRSRGPPALRGPGSDVGAGKRARLRLAVRSGAGFGGRFMGRVCGELGRLGWPRRGGCGTRGRAGELCGP